MKIWLNFGFFDDKKVGKYKNFFRLKFLGPDLCLSWVAPFYTTQSMLHVYKHDLYVGPSVNTKFHTLVST